MALVRYRSWRTVGIYFYLFFITQAQAAAPVVALESHPLITARCAAGSADKLIYTKATSPTRESVAPDTCIFQGVFSSLGWDGSVRKICLGQATAGSVINAEWDAATQLANIEPRMRRIFTVDSSMNVIAFEWEKLSTRQKAMFNTSPGTGAVDALGSKRLDYVRGDQQHEVGQPRGIFRSRNKIFGAVVQSAPALVAAPPPAIRGPDYETHRVAHAARTPVVYVGANDGMLHAIDAGTGKELYAYIPAALLDRLTLMTTNDDARRLYVNGPVMAVETSSSGIWRTALVVAMGGGAQGLFALDVSNPLAFDQGPGVIWEFTDLDDADMGNVIDQPVVAKFRVGSAAGTPVYRDFVVVTSGLNNYLDDGPNRSNGKAANALFLLALDKPKSQKWIAGVNYFKVPVPAGLAHLANGLAAPALVLTNEGAAAGAYMGDLQGNVWRVDFNVSSSWSGATAGATVKLLFTAIDDAGNRQPITQKPQIVFAPDAGYIVMFGTGKLMEASDVDRLLFRQQSFYAVHDTLDNTGLVRQDLTQRHLTSPVINSASGYEVTGENVVYGSAGARQRGWFLDLPDALKLGERSIDTARIVDGAVLFQTLIPDSDPCKTASGRSYVLNTLTGFTTAAAVTALPIVRTILQTPLMVSSTSEITARDASGKIQVKKKNELLRMDDKGQPVMSPLATDGTVTTAGRLGWRELINWREQKAANGKK